MNWIDWRYLGNMKNKFKFSWFDKIYFKLFPQKALRSFTKKMGGDNEILDLLHTAFEKAGKIEIRRTSSNERGFILTIDRKLSFYFYQNGDAFEYDGYEAGEYDEADVTIFDR